MSEDTGSISVKLPEPLGSYVLVRPAEYHEKTTASGLVISLEGQAPKNVFIGDVLALGPHLKGKHISIGDRIVGPEFAGFEVNLGTETYRFVPEKEVLGVL